MDDLGGTKDWVHIPGWYKVENRRIAECRIPRSGEITVDMELSGSKGLLVIDLRGFRTDSSPSSAGSAATCGAVGGGQRGSILPALWALKDKTPPLEDQPNL
jgi:hypothetical protein